MKKMISLLLILVLLLPMAALAATATGTFTGYASDFSSDTDGWYGRGATVFNNEFDELRVTGRTASWNSPGRDFDFTPGVKYNFSFTLWQDGTDSADFLISVAHSKDGVETYENLAAVTSESKRWTVVSGSYTPDEYDNYCIYVETVGSETLEFSIKKASVEPAGIIYGDLPSLHEAYADYFDVGCCITNGQISDESRINYITNQFNIMTHENDLKPDSVLDVNASRALAKEDDTAVAVRFTAARPLLDYCKKNNIKVHGHVLVWHSQTPEEFFHVGYNRSAPYVSREVMLARMENYIRQVFEYTETNYPGVIVSWDVVNEAVADNSSNLRSSNWTKVVGQDFVNRAFEYARKYAPATTKLYYNDYSTPYEPKLTGICNLLDSLIADGTIDGYGFQCHYSATSPSPTMVRNAMQRIADKGLLLRVSELDVGIRDKSNVQLITQAKRYAALWQIFMDFSDQMEAVQVWGVTDEKSWRSGEFPLLFDNKARPKPAFYSILELVQPSEEAAE